MGKKRNLSSRFRKTLKQELTAWQADGTLTPEQAGEITQRYDLSELEKESVGTLMRAIYIIGAVLVGAGVVSFVAAHWTQLGQWIKLCLILSAMLTCHIVGFYFWKVSGKRAYLGHGLVTLGTLIFGANIGLLAQIFHLDTDVYSGFGAWAIGAAAMAYAVGSTPNALIAVAASFVWFSRWAVYHERKF